MRLSHVILVILAAIAGSSYYLQPASVSPTSESLTHSDKQSLELLSDIQPKSENHRPDLTHSIDLPSVLIDPTLQNQAARYVSDFAEPASKIISIQEADHFVGRDQILKLIPQLHGNQVEDIDQTVTAIVNALPDQSDIVISEYNPDESAQTINGTIFRNNATAVQSDFVAIPEITLASEKNTTASSSIKNITLSELINNSNTSDDSVFYVRTVNRDDQRGIWGIIVDGITQNFAEGVAVRRGENVANYKINIPQTADRLRTDSSSSFLGRLVHRKSMDSHVYNFQKNRMGKNPHLIYPGQELVIVNFEPSELVAIYSHFVSNADINN